MKNLATLIAAMVLACAGHAQAQTSREISFPETREGWRVLSVDTHSHTVFSDGHVWPNIRVVEAARDHLDALAVTEHIDTQAKRADVLHPDRNRSYELTQSYAKQFQSELVVIRGVEIARPTRGGECGECSHFNAVFTQDNTPLRHREWDGILPWKSEAPLADAFESIQAAKKQGAFIIWNHPGEEFPVKLTDYNRKLLREKLIDGIEVVNGRTYWEGAFQFALENNLAIIGATDIHDTVDNMLEGRSLHKDYGLPMDHRPVTLVLARDKSGAAIKQAFEAHRTLAFYRHTLIGRETEVRPVVEAALSLQRVPNESGADATSAAGSPKWVIRNASSSPFQLRRLGADRILTAGPVIEVPARGETVFEVQNGGSLQSLSLKLEVMNALTAPQRALQITLKD